MNSRTAKKIVAQFASRPLTYTPEQVAQAHRTVGRPPAASEMESYLSARAAQAAKVEDRKQGQAALAGTAKARREANIARLEARRADRIAIRRQKEAARLAALPKETVVQVGAVEAKIEAGADGVLGTADDEVTIQKAGTAYSEMGVAELKALCKDKGLSGYSKMKKDELVDLLTKS
jgi:hypothetical protein